MERQRYNERKVNICIRREENKVVKSMNKIVKRKGDMVVYSDKDWNR